MSTATSVPARRRLNRPGPAPAPGPHIDRPRRPVSSLTRTRSWSDPIVRGTASVQVLEGQVVLRFTGRLTPAALRICRPALRSALRVRAPVVDIDLTAARVDHHSIDPLADLVHSAARAGVFLRLHGLPVLLRPELARIAPTRHYALAPLPVPDPAGIADGSVSAAAPEVEPEVPRVDEMIINEVAFLSDQRWAAYSDLVVIECVRRSR